MRPVGPDLGELLMSSKAQSVSDLSVSVYDVNQYPHIYVTMFFSEVLNGFNFMQRNAQLKNVQSQEPTNMVR